MRSELQEILRGNWSLLAERPYYADAPLWAEAITHELHLVLAAGADRLGIADTWPEDARRHAKRALVDASVVEMMRRRELVRILKILADVGIGVLVFKGAVLGCTHYPAPHLRPRSDTDLLIQEADVPSAREVLEASGYRRPVEVSGATITSQFHVDRTDTPPGIHALDVHWRVANPRAFSEKLDYAHANADAVSIPDLGPHARTPCDGVALAIACIHRIAHHRDSDLLLWLWDVHLLVSRLSRADGDRFIATAASSSTCGVCAASLERTAECFGTPEVPPLIDRLRAASGGRAEASLQFAGGGVNLAGELWSDLRTVSWRDRMALLREHVFPPMDYMKARYSAWPAPLLPFAYVHRVLRGAPKWMRP